MNFWLFLKWQKMGFDKKKREIDEFDFMIFFLPRLFFNFLAKTMRKLVLIFLTFSEDLAQL